MPADTGYLNGEEPPSFGEPHAEDGTARFDRITGEARKDFMRAIAEGSKVLNRPLGSKLQSPTEKQEEYDLLYRGNPEKLLEALESYVSQSRGNEIKAGVGWTRWVIKMHAGGTPDAEPFQPPPPQPVQPVQQPQPVPPQGGQRPIGNPPQAPAGGQRGY